MIKMANGHEAKPLNNAASSDMFKFSFEMENPMRGKQDLGKRKKTSVPWWAIFCFIFVLSGGAVGAYLSGALDDILSSGPDVIDPSLSSSPVAVSKGKNYLSTSSTGQLYILEQVSTSGATIPAGRSYSGYAWEGVQPFAFDFACAAGESSCLVNLPAGQYQVRAASLNFLASHEDAEISRLLTQTTFGPRRADISSFKSLTSSDTTFTDKAKTFLLDQMSAPVTSLREYYRKRANFRLPMHGLGAGKIRDPCEQQSRWHRFVFTQWDIGKEVTVDTSGSVSLLLVDGEIRTEVTTADFTSDSSIAPFVICTVVERVGGKVKFGQGCNGETENQAIEFATTTPPAEAVAVTAPASSFVDLSPTVSDVKLLQDSTSRTCSDYTMSTKFALSQPSTYYKFDPKVVRPTNTIENPAEVTAVGGDECHVTKKNLFNSAHCVTDTSSCLPPQFSDTQITLNDATIKKFYELGSKHVHYVEGLPINDVDSPCSSTKSRFILRANSVCSSDSTDSSIKSTIEAAILASTDANTNIIDINIKNDCSGDGVGAKVSVTKPDGTELCYEHTHPDEHGVFDFSLWVLVHTGNADAFKGGRANPIAQFALNGLAKLTFPGWHNIARWDSGRKDVNKQAIVELGRLGDQAAFSSLPREYQFKAMADYVGATSTPADEGGVEICGSPGEVANDPSLGFRYTSAAYDFGTQRTQASKEADQRHNSGEGKEMVWTNIVMKGQDQLRHRVAWALSQILVVSSEGAGGTGETEKFLVYYDIFVRNAFGNYREVLREVSYSPVMASMLSFLNSKSFAKMRLQTGADVFPDENYARELMQLFTIGLFKLNVDGTHALTSEGHSIQSYDNDDIMAFSRVWTGFIREDKRGNIETSSGDNSANSVDPLRIDKNSRDVFPKTNTLGGYLGDGAPLCEDLPERAFLNKGAKYRYLGSSDVPEMMYDPYSTNTRQSDNFKHMVLEADTSGLYAELCRAGSDGKCRFLSEVILSGDVACDGTECLIQSPRVVRLNVPGASAPTYYEYVRDECVELMFYENATLVTDHKGYYRADKPTSSGSYAACANSNIPLAQATCCTTANDAANAWGSVGGGNGPQVYFTGERVTREEAVRRCEANGRFACSFSRTDYDGVRAYWNHRSCKIQIQVNPDGFVSRVDDVGPRGIDHVLKDNHNYFKVRWTDGNFPKVEEECGGGDCALHTSAHNARSCICNITVDSEVVFEGPSPTREQVLESLSIGALDPSGDSQFTSSSQAGVKAWTKASEPSAQVFEVADEDGKTVFLKNVLSTVKVDGGSLAFRNPPNYMSSIEATARDATYETDALIDHLLRHPNTAPFISHRLIQRLVTSNPSPRYVGVVAEAFRSGNYAGVGTGEHGDLAATVAAIFLDREARDVVLDADPAFGLVREPILKLLHFMRSMEFETTPGNEELELKTMSSVIGQQIWKSPTVFNFYEPYYVPPQLVEHRLSSPEAELLNAPYVIGFMNGLTSLVRYGLTRCWGGFAWSARTGCQDVDDGYLLSEDLTNTAGRLTFTPTAVDVPDSETYAPTPAPVDATECADDPEWRRWNPASSTPYNGQSCATAAQKMAEGNTYWCKESSTTYVDENGVTCYEACPVACGSCPQDVSGLVRGKQAVEEMSLLLTAGRLSDLSKKVIEDEYEKELGRYANVGKATRAAQQLFAVTPEFHSTGANEAGVDGEMREVVEEDAATRDADYKAVVYLMMFGAADSYNFLVPHSGCGDKDMYEDYNTVRGNVALGKGSLLQIDSGSSQVCSKFGMHPKMNWLKQLYEDGDAAWVANVGVLTEPVTQDDFHKKSNKVPPSLFAHNSQAQALHTANPHDPTGSGWLGRVKDSLVRKGYSVGSYSISGTAKVLETDESSAADVVHGSNGVVPFDTGKQMTRLMPAVKNLTSARGSNFMAETWSSSLQTIMKRTDKLKEALDGLGVEEDYGDSGLGKQFSQVSKLIKANMVKMKNERDIFYVYIGGWDTHANLGDKMDELLTDVDDSLESFTKEMKALGMWDSVTIASASDFGRTLTDNGVGTDHAWAGNHFLAGGAVKGGTIHGTFIGDYGDEGHLNIGRGRLIPTTPWDGVWNSVIRWFGVEDEDEVEKVLPNLKNFQDDHVLKVEDVFD
mmetsp:Transcript_20151/g.41987  ORF Transcript_20151/g.41987 Transcript_20151/m.41987 type:complete len:2123 (-) Transcript_20151:67-6435(-)